MGSTKEEQDRVRNLLLDTVTLLCKNGLNFKQQLKVQGLLGITLDDDSVFIVHINEQVGEAVPEKKDVEESSDQSSIDSRRSSRDSQTTPYKNRKRTADTSPVFRGPPEKIKVKMEKEDTDEDLILLHDENDIDDKSHLKAQMLHQQQANVPSVTNIHSGFSQFNPQNNMHQPGGPFISGVSGTHTMTPLTPGGTPEKQWKMGSVFPYKQQHCTSKDTKEKPFSCDYPGCSHAYFSKHNLRRHQTKIHGRLKRPSSGPRSYNTNMLELYQQRSECTIQDGLNMSTKQSFINSRNSPNTENKFTEAKENANDDILHVFKNYDSDTELSNCCENADFNTDEGEIIVPSYILSNNDVLEEPNSSFDSEVCADLQ